MTRVLLVANWVDDLGGVQTATKALATALAEAGAETSVVSAFRPTDPDRPAPTPALFAQPPAAAVPRPLRARLADTRWGRLDVVGRRRAVRRLERAAAGVDAVLAMDVFAAELVAEADLGGARRWFQYHNSFSNIEGSRDLARVVRIAPRLAGVVALSGTDAEGFRAAVDVPVHAVPNVQPAGDRAGRAPDRLVVGLGRYTAAKHFGLALDAWADLAPAAREGWRLELHGDGPEREALERAAVEGVRVSGPTADVRGLLRRADVLVLPSDHEGLPMVLLEAMAAGVACVATRSSPGVAELLDDAGRGCLLYTSPSPRDGLLSRMPSSA